MLRCRAGGLETEVVRLGGRIFDVEAGDEDGAFVGFVEVEDRGRSREGVGVESEKASDFRLAGGKKPRDLRGIRPICVGLESLGSSTQESCFQGGSESVLEFEWDDEGGCWLLEAWPLEFHPLGRIL